MSKLVTIKLNGSEYQVPEGMNLIDAAESVGIHIPNLCYLKGMKGIGACRMCLVESSGRSMTACIMKTKEGMDIVTENDKIRELRKFVIDLIVSMHPLDCMTCTKAGTCNLQNYAYEFGLKDSSFSRKSFGFSTDEANPFIKRDPDYCVLCGRCVRVCKEQGTGVLDFIGRGVGSKVSTAGDRPLQESGCTFCGSCVDVCPVNALVEADRWRKGREWEYVKTGSVCLACGSACAITVSVHEGMIAKVRSGAEDGSVEHYVCAVGRYGFDSVVSDQRILTPMVRENGALRPAGWDEALKKAADALKAGEAGILATGALVNEDAAALADLAAKAGIANVATTVSLYGDEASLIGSGANLDEADLVVAVGLDASQWKRVLPGLDALIRKKVDRKAKLAVINSQDTPLAEIATLSIATDEADALKGLAKALVDKGVGSGSGMDLGGATVTEELGKVAEMYKEAASPVIIAAPSLFEAARTITLLKGAAVSVASEANAAGTLLAGLTGKGKSYRELAAGGVKTLYAVGGVPAIEAGKRPSVDTLIVQDSYFTALAREADVVLPAACFYETSGTIVDYLGRLRKVARTVEPAGEAKAHREITAALGSAMGKEIGTASAADMEKRLSAVAGATARPFVKRAGLEAHPQELEPMGDGSPLVKGTRLAWLVETEKSVAV